MRVNYLIAIKICIFLIVPIYYNIKQNIHEYLFSCFLLQSRNSRILIARENFQFYSIYRQLMYRQLIYLRYQVCILSLLFFYFHIHWYVIWIIIFNLFFQHLNFPRLFFMSLKNIKILYRQPQKKITPKSHLTIFVNTNTGFLEKTLEIPLLIINHKYACPKNF